MTHAQDISKDFKNGRTFKRCLKEAAWFSTERHGTIYTFKDGSKLYFDINVKDITIV